MLCNDVQLSAKEVRDIDEVIVYCHCRNDLVSDIISVDLSLLFTSRVGVKMTSIADIKEEGLPISISLALCACGMLF